FGAADEARFFGFPGSGDADALYTLGRFFFTVVVVGDLILVTVDAETDLSQIDLGTKVMCVTKFRLRSGAIFRIFKFNPARQTEAILQVTFPARQFLRTTE